MRVPGVADTSYMSMTAASVCRPSSAAAACCLHSATLTGSEPAVRSSSADVAGCHSVHARFHFLMINVANVRRLAVQFQCVM